MDDKLKKELLERIGRIQKNQLSFDVGPDVPREISAAIMLMLEVSDVSSTAFYSMAKSIQSATGVSGEKLAAEMLTWFDGSLDQPPPINKGMSLAIGYLANLYLHKKLCDEISKGPNNIGNIALSLENMQKGLFRLVCAGLNSDPLLASNEGIRSFLKKQMAHPHDAVREKGEKTDRLVKKLFTAGTWEKPYNASDIARAIEASLLAKRKPPAKGKPPKRKPLGFEAIYKVVRPLVSQLKQNDKNSQ